MNIAVVGLGLIGGSIAKSIKKEQPHTVLGADASQQVLYKAKLLEAIDGELTPERLGICDMVIIATWPRDAVGYVKQHGSQIRQDALVMDVSGVKRAVCEPLWALAQEKSFTFIGGHPMAGIEYTGFDNATTSLFAGASMVITPPPGMDIALLDRVKRFWRGLGFERVVITTPEKHDRMIAYTSQLAHVVSSAYVKSPSAQEHQGFSAGSFRDMTRVARLNEDLWAELFMLNREPLLEELDILLDHLGSYRAALEAGDEARLRGLLREGRELKEKADGEEGKL